MLPDNFRTYGLKLTRGEVIKILLLLDTLETLNADTPTNLYMQLREKIKRQFDELDEKNGIK